MAAKAVIDHLGGEGWQEKSLEPAPQRHLSPDLVAVLDDGRRIGIEVTELCDECSAKRAQAVKEGREAAHFYRDWDVASLQAKLRSDLSRKDHKAPDRCFVQDRKRRAWGDLLDEYLVEIHIDEPLISSQLAEAALRPMAPVEVSQVTKAFFLIWYVPRSVGHRPKIYEIPVLSGRS